MNENGGALGGCSHGYDYADNDVSPLPSDEDGAAVSHGTFIAGIIGGTKNNSIGVIGVAPQVKIMAIRSDLTTTTIVQGIG
ncbi:MAG: S8 family serine peptidase, partial [Candidatus Zixiibacteriota bacterium]